MQSLGLDHTEVPSHLTVRQFAYKYPAFSESSLRWLIFNQETNGFAAAFVKLGRRILINEKRFFQVVDGKNIYS